MSGINTEVISRIYGSFSNRMNHRINLQEKKHNIKHKNNICMRSVLPMNLVIREMLESDWKRVAEIYYQGIQSNIWKKTRPV